MKKIVCTTCPHHCSLEEGQTGLCGARRAQNGKIVCINYGKVTSLSLDPIEKKPFKRFFPGSKILSVGSFGCNLSCPFCQNYKIVKAPHDRVVSAFVSPKELIEQAVKLLPEGNIGLAYVYNEPLIGWEYVLDCAKLAKERGLVNVIVSNGYCNPAPLVSLLPYIDAANIDLKCFSNTYYKKLGGSLEPVKNTIKTLYKQCHVEVTTLIIPDENDSDQETEELSEWLASVGRDIPLHISKFYPRYHYVGRTPTPVSTVYRLAGIARKYLDTVYEGNC
ncbi:MAG: AmmeMemoRadiSam system radical SAM enzyme [Clostridia bacterium]|nr:AmmeMemoRadiSam system radical SAM enzyme [Clostridia bacterium]